MLTHRLYSEHWTQKTYFSGTCEDKQDESGMYSEVDWKWTHNPEEATLFATPDAWNLLGYARNMFPDKKMELERIYTLNEVERMR